MNPNIALAATLFLAGIQSFSHADVNVIKAAEVEESYWDKAKRLYDEKVKDREIPSQLKDAAQKDFEKIGDWRYLVLEIKGKDPEKLTEFLNEAGNERWECFFIEPQKEGALFYFKRREMGYIEKLSKADLLRLLGSLGSE
ncbi:MAG: hypothetical protein AAF065_11070 [Verrucomicrobiota bacterium]